MRAVVLACLASGCQLVFTLDDRPPPPAQPPAKCVEEGVQLCLTFDTLEDGRTPDDSGNANDATLVDVEPADRDGRPAVSLGPTSEIRIENVNTLNFPGALSFEAFFRWRAVGEGAQAVLDSVEQWGMGVSGLGVGCTFFFEATPFASFPQSGGIRPNEWQHIACVFDPAVGTQLFLDGMLKTTDPAVIGGVLETMKGGRVRIGGFDNNTALFQGDLDDVRILDRVMTEAEINATVNAD